MNTKLLNLFLLTVVSIVHSSIISLFLSACTSDNNFQGNLETINDEVEEILLTSSSKYIDSIYSPILSIVDSIVLFYVTNRENAYEIVELSTGNKVGAFCPIGHGAGEYIALSPIRQIYQEENDYKAIMFAPNESKILIWNISKSLRSGRTTYEYIGDYSWKNKYSVSYSKQVVVGKDSILFYTPSVHISSPDQLTNPLYQVRTLKSNEQIKEFQIFRHTIDNKASNVLPENFLDASFSLKPNRRLFVEAMNWLPQINIVDIKTGEINGYRISDIQNEDVFSTNMEDALFCYKSVVSDEQFIYALWAGEKKKDLRPDVGYKAIHIYDWEGNLLLKCQLEYGINELSIDVRDGALYGWNIDQQQIYKFALDALRTL